MPDFPLIQTIRIPTLSSRLVDERNASRDDQIVARDIMREVLEELVLGTVRPATQLCGMQNSEHVERLRADAVAADSSIPPQVAALDGDAFEASLGDSIVIDESDCDPRLPVLTFLLIEDGDIIRGLFTLYNIVVEQQNPGRQTASAMAMPGIVAPTGATLNHAWSEVMRFILAMNLRVQDAAPDPGQIIDFVEFRFPQRPSHEWKEAQLVQGLSGDLVVAAVAVGNNLSRRPDGVPEFVRRNGAPPRP